MVVCTPAFFDLLNGNVLMLAGLASLLTGLIIIATYMFSQAVSNPKLLVWAKTEAIQIFISIASVLLLIAFINSFCSFKLNDVYSLTGVLVNLPQDALNKNIYESAEQYLIDAASFTHNVLNIQRYHLAAFNILESRSLWVCDSLCLFGASGYSVNPHSGATALSSGFNLSINSTMFSYFSVMNSLMILQFSYNGMALFFLPFGIFMRSMPYFRGFGSLLIAIAISFMVVYPTLLSVFFLISKEGSFYNLSADLKYFAAHEDDLTGNTYTAGTGTFSESDSSYKDFIYNGHNPSYQASLAAAGRAFIVGSFLTNLALLAAIASVSYISRLIGEEIDLSRIIQMV